MGLLILAEIVLRLFVAPIIIPGLYGISNITSGLCAVHAIVPGPLFILTLFPWDYAVIGV
jgi:hypothetical protein